MRRAALLGSCLALPACSLAFSLDGYEGSAKALPDGGTSVLLPDGGVAPSPGAEGGTGDAGGSGFCPAGALFCDDFERTDTTNVRGAWDSLNAQGGTIAIAGGQPTGDVLKVHVDASGTSATVDLEKNFGAITSKATIASKFFYNADPGAGGMHFNRLDFIKPGPVGTAPYSALFPYLLEGNAGLVIGELVCADGTNCNYKQSGIVKPAPNAWHDLSFSVDFTTSPATLTVILDGATAIQTASQAGAFSGTLLVQAGAAFVDGNHGNYDVMIDQVVVTGS